MEARILEMCYRERRPLPEAIKNAPELTLGLEFHYKAYWDLSTCRDYGFGFGPIPWFSINEYARSFDLDPDETYDFHYLMRAMDKKHLEYVESKRAEDAASRANAK